MLYINIKRHLESFDLEVELEGQEGRIGLLGASGAGKSMILKMIAGIEIPDEGIIILNDKILFDSKRKINLPSRARKVGYLFQNYALFPHMTVAQNIVSGMRGRSKIEKEIELKKRIEQLELYGLEGRYPKQLSGGQQQRVAIGRMLSANPDILMFDEPFSALDFHLKDLMQEQLLEMLDQVNKTSLVVSHDIDEAYRLCHKIAIVNKGKIEVYDTKEKIFANPRTLSTALITGCKNISRVNKLSNTSIYALDWGITLSIPLTLEEIDYVGIRAHHIRMVSKKEENCFEYSVVKESETRFNKTIMLRVIGKENVDHELRLDADKEWWKDNMIDRPKIQYVQLSQERLLLLKNK